MSNTPNNNRPDPLAGWSHLEPPFHAGERELQARYGLADRLAQVGRKIMREGMPEEHREFFAELPFVVVGSVDAQGHPWASVLAGEPGFLHSPDVKTLTVRARPAAGDPLAENLELNANLGLLGIQFDTRRRNRVNGKVQSLDDIGFSLRVEQSFGNCPKYIHRRRSEFSSAPAGKERAVTREDSLLSARALEIISASDTFFIASVAPQASAALEDHARGVDISHRGGPAGFVHVQASSSGHVLTIPDYSGNYFFNTFGNLLLHPYAGLVFIDFDDGTLLQLTGSTELILDEPELELEPGAERMLRFRVTEGRLLQSAIDLKFRALR